MFQVCRTGVPGEGAATRRLITNLDLLATCVYGSGDEAPLLTQAAVKYMEIPKSSYVRCVGSVVKGEQSRAAGRPRGRLPVRRDPSSGQSSTSRRTEGGILRAWGRLDLQEEARREP
ncbi:hypothetical protein E2C01_011772 [Portunus trituberculatus]|uniref:Uncharacterized protein n=1 Tax=Portunus trituberculatus TaxID=210409 RepID=A0A5B7DCE2_PORTR|nr:hypothetical protein [Portunus trituberculatus]